MQRFLNALVAYMQNTNNSMNGFIGFANNQSGPFLDVAVEGCGFPYTTYTVVGGTPNWQGFSTIYVAKVHLQLTVRDTNPDTVATNTEFMASKLDTLTTLTLASPEVTRLPIRIEEPRYAAEPIDENGQRVYAGILEYRFNVQRTRGV